MNKRSIAKIVTLVVDTIIPTEVSRLVKSDCLIVVDDLSDWAISPSRHNAKGKELLGIFGFENGKPIIGLNHKTLTTTEEVIKTAKHEIAHFALWHSGLPNGERAANRLASVWEQGGKYD